MKIVSAVAVLLCLLSSVPPAGAGKGPDLVVRTYEHGREWVRIPVQYGQIFSIHYIHSVDHFPITEVFRVAPGVGIVLVETYFTMFGAGLGYWPGHGKLTQRGRWIVIENIEDPVGRFILRIGAKTVAHTLKVGEFSVNLSDLAAGKRVEVFVSGE